MRLEWESVSMVSFTKFNYSIIPLIIWPFRGTCRTQKFITKIMRWWLNMKMTNKRRQWCDSKSNNNGAVCGVPVHRTPYFVASNPWRSPLKCASQPWVLYYQLLSVPISCLITVNKRHYYYKSLSWSINQFDMALAFGHGALPRWKHT